MSMSLVSSLRFAGDLPPIAVGLLAVAAGLFVVWLYAKESQGVSSPYSYLLPGLRASAVMLTILILAGPVWHNRKVIGTLGHVVFAIDQSKSMSITDSGESGSTPDRMGRAAAMLLGDDSREGWLDTLSKSHEVDVVAFSSGEPTLLWSSRGDEPQPESLEITPDGEATDLSVSLRSALDGLDPNRVGATGSVGSADVAERSALVMITDGRDNDGESATDIARQLKTHSMVVHAVGMGSQEEPADVGIVNVVRPESVASDGVLAGSLVLKQFGLSGKPVRVRIESGDSVVWEKTINTAGDGLQNIPFQFDVESIVKRITSDAERGIQRSTVVMDLRAAVEPLEGDSASENNAKAFRVAANTRDRRLLILDGASRWETRYLRNVFERDPAWTVHTILFGPGTNQPKLIRGDRDGEFPDDQETMSRYDAVIIGEIPGDQLTSDDILRLQEFVARGGGLIAIDGRFGNLRKLIATKLADLIPVTIAGSGTQKLVGLSLTTLGLEHPVMNLTGDSDELADFWRRIPAPKSASLVQPQEGAEVWANVRAQNGQETPWMVTRLFGAGRVFYFSSDESWRWRYKVADRFHARFWNQLLSAVMQPPYSASDEYVALGTDKVEYLNGQAATIRVRLHDTNRKPVGDATVDALLIAEDRIVGSVPLTLDDPARGTYRGQTPPLPTGSYQVRVRASGFDESALQASTPIWVSAEETREMQRVGLDENALTQITNAGGGRYVHESIADNLLEQIKPLSSGTVQESDILIWQTYYWFWAVIALLAVEWFLRKRAGLV